MKKFFITLGIFFLVLILLGAIGIGYFAYQGNRLDKESKAYVDKSIPALATNWSKKELLDRASPELRREASDALIDELFKQFSTLGRFMTSDAATGQSSTYVSPQTGKIVTADYQAKVYFEKGGGTIKVKLIKHGDQWQISSFNLVSPQLGAIGTGYVAFLDDNKGSKAYADAAITAIITNWNEKELLDRASPEFKQAVTQQQLDTLFRGFRGLGHLKKREPAEGHATMSVPTLPGNQIGAEYTSKAAFDKATVIIDMALIKHGAQWQIIGFFVRRAETAAK